MDTFQAPVGCLVQPSVRCLVGLYGIQKDDVLDQAFSAVLDVETEDDPELLRRALDVDDSDQIQFLVGSQSLNYDENQVILVTLLEGTDEHLPQLVKQSFPHPDGEVMALVAVAAQPSWFISVYSAYCPKSAEFRSGARVWRLPINSPSGPSSEPKTADGDQSELEYITSLPLGNYAVIKKIASHPSANCADLACLATHPVNSSSTAGHLSTSITHLVLLQAPSASSPSGDYRELASAPLCWPTSSRIFASHLKANPTQLIKSTASTDQVPITCKSHAIRWSPFQQAGHLAVAFESGVLGWDIRSMKPSFWLEAAHWPCVRDLDFNPHRPSILATGGDDGYIRLWDLRYLKPKTNVQSTQTATSFLSNPEQCTEPLHSVAAHSHWVWSVRYHPTRDQLLLSAGSDSRVCLHNLSSFSSDALDNVVQDDLEDNDEDDGRSSTSSLPDQKSSVTVKLKDGVVARMELHEESIYAADWSPVDPWYFASVSYDGNLLVSQVPEALKFKILLDETEE